MEKMKIPNILILLLVLFSGPLMAQTDYNKKGDEAMRNQDYRKASMWYEEGVMRCDSYSIEQLTTIWKQNEEMRSSMRGLMSKCFDCLRDKATIDGDTTAISQLVFYYREGVGTIASEEQAKNWSDHLEKLRQPKETTTSIPAKKNPKQPMKFFVGYAYSIEAPYGLTVGGVGRRLGWYARFKSDFSSGDYTNECRGDRELVTIPEDAAYRFTNNKKSSNKALSAGLVVKCAPWLYTSVGVGYGERKLLYEYNTIPYSDSQRTETFWAKNTDYSYSGIVAELDFMVKFGPMFVSVGCNTLKFEYVDLNAGLGVFF